MVSRLFGRGQTHVDDAEILEHARRQRGLEARQREIEARLFWQMQQDILDARRQHDRHPHP